MIRILTSLALSLTLAACGGQSPPSKPDARSPVHLGSNAVTAPNFGDRKPIDSWGGRPPQNYAVHGIDVARYQTSVDWATARANGVNFAFIKATEGGDRVDPMFEEHWRGAGRAGLRKGAYHFYYHCRPAAEQARWFIRHVPKARGNLPPVLDMEWTPFSPTCTLRREASVIREEARVFIDILARHYGQRPILYTSIDFFEDNEMWKVSGADFWLRAVAKHPQDLYNGQHWAFWQYSSTGLVPGIAGEVDLNVFAGSPAQWSEWLAARAP